MIIDMQLQQHPVIRFRTKYEPTEKVVCRREFDSRSVFVLLDAEAFCVGPKDFDNVRAALTTPPV